jgi:NADH-quinone oxidoreductase subunit N
MGVVVTSSEGISAILYFLAGYLFTLLAAFIVISVATKRLEDKDLSALAGLHRRSPLLAAGMAMAMVSLAGVPPLAGFFGKFLLIKAALAQALVTSGFFWLLGVAIFGVLVSFYYYFGVIRAMYWEPAPDDASALEVSGPMSWALYTCMAGILFLGLFPNTVVNLTQFAAQALNLP